jgi:hypothetical protein
MAIINDSAISNQIANLVNGGSFDVSELTSIINSGLPTGQQLQVGAGLVSGPFKRFGSFDKVDAKTEVVTTGLWTGDVGSLTSFYTSSTQKSATSGDYYYNVYQADPSGSSAEVQFAVAYGHVDGSGSVSLTNDDTSTLPTKATYKQYGSTLLNDADNKFAFENGSGVATDSNSIYAINLSRTRFREKMDPGNWSLTLTGANGTFTFIDNSGKKFGDTLGNAGRVFKVVSGSLNLGTENEATINTVTSSGDEGFGLFYPDRGIIILNPSAIQATVGSVDAGTLVGDEGVDANKQNHERLFQAIAAGGDFESRRTENVSTQHFFVRATNREFNYSNNPTYTNNDGTFVETSFETDPKTYITTVGLYNDSNEMIAIAKTSQPIPKSFDKEVLIKVKLSF